MSATPIIPSAYPCLDLASLIPGATFFLGSRAEVQCYCEVIERRDDRIRFITVNGGWSGAVSTATGVLLSIGDESLVNSDAEVIYTADLPQGINHGDYNAAISYVNKLLKSAASLDLTAVGSWPSPG